MKSWQFKRSRAPLGYTHNMQFQILKSYSFLKSVFLNKCFFFHSKQYNRYKKCDGPNVVCVFFTECAHKLNGNATYGFTGIVLYVFLFTTFFLIVTVKKKNGKLRVLHVVKYVFCPAIFYTITSAVTHPTNKSVINNRS